MGVWVKGSLEELWHKKREKQEPKTELNKKTIEPLLTTLNATVQFCKNSILFVFFFIFFSKVSIITVHLSSEQFSSI